LFFKHFIHLAPKSRPHANFPARLPRPRATIKKHPPTITPRSLKASFLERNNILIFNTLHQQTISASFPSVFAVEILETTCFDAVSFTQTDAKFLE